MKEVYVEMIGIGKSALINKKNPPFGGSFLDYRGGGIAFSDSIQWVQQA
jgi:hypothetical protein